MNNIPRDRISPSRMEAVERVRQSWISRLIDLSRRNNLLYYRDLKTGALDFSQANNQALSRLLGGEAIPIAQLLPEADETVTVACLRSIQRRTQTNLEERGLETLFLACGMATWTSSDGGRPTLAAVLLVPIVLQTKGITKLQRNGEAQVNPILLHVLETEHAVEIAQQDLLDGVETVAEEEVPDLSSIYSRLAHLAEEVKGFTVHPQLVLSNFSFQKMAMVRDLRDCLEQMAAHDIIAAIAGDVEARESLCGTRQAIVPQALDQISPDNEFLVFDADSSQQRVIQAILSNKSGVIQGPPGTGKSQTIANLIAALAAEGKRVLFVAEKRAALEVVMQRLNQKGLGHLLLDFHSADVSRRQVMQQFAESLEEVRNSFPVSSNDVHRRFVEQRIQLNKHVERLHTKRLPANLSVYDVQGELLSFSEEERVLTRFRGSELEQLNTESAETVAQLLGDASGNKALVSLLLNQSSSPWQNARLASGKVALRARDAAKEIANEQYPKFLSSLTDVVAITKFTPPSNLEQARDLLSLIREVQHTLSLYSANLFQQDLDKRVHELRPLRSGFIVEGLSQLFDGTFKHAKSTLHRLRIAGKTSDHQLLEEVTVAAEQLRRWRSLSSSKSIPCKILSFDTTDGELNVLQTNTAHIESCLGKKLSQLPLRELATLFKALAADSNTPDQLVRLQEIEQKIEELGASAILTEIKRLKTSPHLWKRQFRYAWLISQLDQARAEDSALATFNRSAHEQIITEFRKLDKDRLELAANRVRRAHAEQAIATMNDYPEQQSLVRREALKKARHLPLRKLLAEAPEVLMALRPCWMASPLSVSQLLDANRRYFDVVIFDEASQVLPEDAIPAILRGVQVVVAGDRYQLPPTTFFASGVDDEDDELSVTAGFESLLDLMSSFLSSWSLLWHYRSQDEALIAFSNRHIYGDRLVTFPGSGGSTCISHVLAEFIPGQDGQEESASQEVRKVVELVLKHATERPGQTLGVITMGLSHAARIEVALDNALKLRPELGAFFDESRSERFFVKNIERVQGDERDAILLSVGYGKDRSGRLPYRFGPLLTEGGERRLNVAITRARQQMILVSSFSHLDMDPNRSKARGVELLRLYLQYATSNGKLLGDTGQTGHPLNPFEADIFEALQAKGISLLPQWGVSQYRIDMVAQHPKQLGQFVLAIECDGASYHSAQTARDRDRLRQQQLEVLGWRFHRIWSTDWFMQREAEIERAVQAYQAAVEYADQADVRNNQMIQIPLTEMNSSSPELPELAITTGHRRGQRPNVLKCDKIADYRQSELASLIRWILSDGRLRTDEEILREMLPELGFKRRGVRIDEAIFAAIQKVRSRF